MLLSLRKQNLTPHGTAVLRSSDVVVEAIHTVAAIRITPQPELWAGRKVDVSILIEATRDELAHLREQLERAIAELDEKATARAARFAEMEQPQ